MYTILIMDYAETQFSPLSVVRRKNKNNHIIIKGDSYDSQNHLQHSPHLSAGMNKKMTESAG